MLDKQDFTRFCIRNNTPYLSGRERDLAYLLIQDIAGKYSDLAFPGFLYTEGSSSYTPIKKDIERLIEFLDTGLSREERKILIILYDEDDWLKFHGREQQICRRLKDQGILEWNTFFSHNPYYRLSDRGREIGKRIWDEYIDELYIV